MVTQGNRVISTFGTQMEWWSVVRPTTGVSAEFVREEVVAQGSRCDIVDDASISETSGGYATV